MNVIATPLAGAFLLEPRAFPDDRGYFLEVFQETRYRACGIERPFVQDNLSRSWRRVLRGLHYQLRRPQGKLLWVVRGEIWDVIVDVRRGSPTYGRWWSTNISDTNHRQLWVPPGLAHGFVVLSDVADVQYKCTDYWCPEDERTIVWNDSTLAIAWPIELPIVSAKDAAGSTFVDAETFE